MRIALISIAGGGLEPVRLAGRPIAWHQLHAALSLGCERIVCLAPAPSAELAALQRAAESEGASFHAAAHHRALAGLVRAADTLVVFAPNVLAESGWLGETLASRTGVATLPETAVERGFERIDRDRAWAGVLAVRGDAAEALHELPPDADPVGGLLRIALQRGARDLPVPPEWLEEGRWALARTPAEAERHQGLWYGREVPPPSGHRPSEAAAHRAARMLTTRGANPRAWATGCLAAGLALALGSAAAGFAGETAPALGGLAFAAALSAIGVSSLRFAHAGTRSRQGRWLGPTRLALIDAALVAIAASPAAFGGWETAFAAAVLVAAMRLAGAAEAPPALRPLSDRVLVLLGLAALAAAERFAGGTALLALAGLALRLFAHRHRG